MSKVASIIPASPARMAAAVAPQPADASKFFHPVEHAILRRFFKLRPRRSDPFDLYQDEDSTWVGMDQKLEQYDLENAVARLCLGAIQQRLPQWACGRVGGGLIFGRDFYARSVREVEAAPVFLFMINWADSGPGMSWLFDTGLIAEEEALLWRKRVWRGHEDV